MLVGLEEEKAVIKTAIQNNESVLIIGETGVGKTSMIRELAKEQGAVFRRLNLNGSTGVEEFVGKITLAAKEVESETMNSEGKVETKKHVVTVTEWQNGILIEAMRKGEWLLVDEINAALPEILFVLQSLLDDDRYVVLADHNGEIVRPHKDFRFFAAMNPPAEYAGTKKLNKALLSRFAVVLKVETPNLETMQKIIDSHVQIDPQMNENICRLAEHINKSKEEDNTEFYCSIRDLISFAKLIKAGSSPETAFRLSILNKADPFDEDAIQAIAQMYIHIAGKPKPLTKAERRDQIVNTMFKTMEPWFWDHSKQYFFAGVKVGAVSGYKAVIDNKLPKEEKDKLKAKVDDFVSKYNVDADLSRRVTRERIENAIKSSCPQQ